MFMAPHRSSLRRFGFTVSKKVGGAVVRNGVRRRLREIVRLNQSAFPPGRCYVIVARPEAATATFTALHDDLLGIAAAARPQTPERRT
jgi:ribonuclease P protein component